MALNTSGIITAIQIELDKRIFASISYFQMKFYSTSTYISNITTISVNHQKQEQNKVKQISTLFVVYYHWFKKYCKSLEIY